MDPIIFTPRLKLTLVMKAERGSPELDWLHELRSNEMATWWSIYGRAKSIEDTEETMRTYLPTSEGEEKTYRVVYAVHKILDVTSGSPEGEPQPIEREKHATEFIGLVTLRSIDASMLALPEDLTIPVAATATTLVVDLGYMFLPVGWGKGYATESVEVVLETFKRAKSFWKPFSKVYIRAGVNEENPASLRVMQKVGMVKRGIYEWTGEAIFFAGKWWERGNIHIFGMHLLG